MEHDAQAAERGLPDLPEQIDLAVGQLTVMAQSLRTGRPLLVKDADAIEQAMLLLAGLQGVVGWEPSARLESARDCAEALRQMATTSLLDAHASSCGLKARRDCSVAASSTEFHFLSVRPTFHLAMDRSACHGTTWSTPI